jgi:predicted PurR-regulated permease PerM
VNSAARADPVEPGAPVPDLSKTETKLRSPLSVSVSISILAVLAVLYTLYFARAFFVPITYAVLLNFLLSPVIRALRRVGIPSGLAAALVLLVMLSALGGAAYGVSGPARTWISKAPDAFATANKKLRAIRRPMEQVTRTAEQMARATSESAVGGAGANKPQEVVIAGPSLVSRVFGTTQSLLTVILEVLILLFFLLAAGDLFLQKLIKVLPQLEDKKTAVEIARMTESSISTYLLTALTVNVSEGLVVAGAMYLLGMPNPFLWGALVAILEFVPYLGALVMVGVLTLAALTTFDSVGHAVLVPITFLVINLIQGNVVSPMLLGKRLTLNPVAIFIGLTLWVFLWGIPGAFIGVPLLAAFKILCDHIESLAGIGEFLGQRDEVERRLTVRTMAQMH